MGQQQLLLIVLGVIIVGIAIVVGINLFNANAEESMKDSIVSEGTNLGAMAQQYYKKPVALGGGGNAFDNSNGGTGWVIPYKLQTTASADWMTAAPTVADDHVLMIGTPLDAGYAARWTVEVYVSADSIASKVVE